MDCCSIYRDPDGRTRLALSFDYECDNVHDTHDREVVISAKGPLFKRFYSYQIGNHNWDKTGWFMSTSTDPSSRQSGYTRMDFSSRQIRYTILRRDPAEVRRASSSSSVMILNKSEGALDVPSAHCGMDVDLLPDTSEGQYRFERDTSRMHCATMKTLPRRPSLAVEGRP